MAKQVNINESIVKEAEEWLGTPFGHQDHHKGLSTDCAGFIVGVARNAGAVPDVELEQSYRRQANGEEMLRLLKLHANLVPSLEEAQPGDILAFIDPRRADPNTPRHLAYLVRRRHDGVLYVIHAGNEAVARHRMDLHWRQRVHSIWRRKNKKRSGRSKTISG
jgi:cell wall-associated NlpC family hydrolase